MKSCTNEKSIYVINSSSLHFYSILPAFLPTTISSIYKFRINSSGKPDSSLVAFLKPYGDSVRKKHAGYKCGRATQDESGIISGRFDFIFEKNKSKSLANIRTVVIAGK